MINNLPFKIQLPVTDPVLVFAIILFVILLAPLVLNKFRIPGIVGLILAGVALGPHGFHILERDNAIILFGTVGVLYIMFLAGLEIDLFDFNVNKVKSIFFGLTTFSIPISIGIFVCHHFLSFSWLASILTSSTFSSNTLISFPIASRLGITKNRAVNIAVGGTMITDILALLVLAVITAYVKGNFDSQFFSKIFISFFIFSFIIIWGYPRIGRWFFRNANFGGISQYTFVIAMVFLAGAMAKAAGVEPIIGSFLAGLSLNRLIPRTSSLMNRLEFVGNALFIPFFLISVGMLVDLRIFFKGEVALIIAASMTILGIFGKWIPAFLTQIIFGFSSIERKVLFGLTTAHAAATLAVVKEGYELGVINDYVLNGSIVMILISCLTSSFVVEKSGRKLAIIENENTPTISEVNDRILVPISNPDNFEYLIDFANLIKDPKSKEPIYPLSVVADGEGSENKVLKSNLMLEKITKYAVASDKPVQVITRVNLNVAKGIVGAVKDLLITEIVIGWNTLASATEFIFGGVVDNLLKITEKMILLGKFSQPINTIKRIVLVVPPKAEYEIGYGRWLNTIVTLAKQKGSSIQIFSNQDTFQQIAYYLKKNRINIPFKYTLFEEWDDFLILSREVQKDDLFVIISARINSISHIPALENIPKRIIKHFDSISCVLIYPEQYPGRIKELDYQTHGIDVSPIQENINRLSKLGKYLKDTFLPKTKLKGEE